MIVSDEGFEDGGNLLLLTAGITRPTDVTKPILERYARWLYHHRKEDGRPLSFGSQLPSAHVDSSIQVQVALLTNSIIVLGAAIESTMDKTSESRRSTGAEEERLFFAVTR